MENLGKYLLDQRVKKELSYKQVWEDVRLSEETIKKIETNRCLDLGGYGVAKAIIYNYARYLEADVDAVMREFKVMMPENTRGQFRPDRLPKEHKIMISTNFLWMIGIIIFVAILGSILIHANKQGWLSTPVFLKSTVRDTTTVQSETLVEEPKPDTLRTRMKALSSSLPKQSQGTISSAGKITAAPDTTDFIGNVLGESPLNVPLH